MIKSIYKASLWMALLGPLCVCAQTSYTDNFNAGNAGWSGGVFTLTAENGAMKVNGKKTFQWDAFSKTFGPIDITTSPYVNIKVKTSKDFNILVGLGSGAMSDGKLIYPDMPLNDNPLVGYPNYEVVQSDDFQEYSFNFSNKVGGDVDFSKITWINILVNPLAPFDNSNGQGFYIDDIEIGAAAKLMPTLSNVLNQGFVVKETGSVAKLVNLRNITDGAEVKNAVTITATSSNQGLISNSNISIDYVSGSRQGNLRIKPTDNVVGDAIITVRASAPNTGADKLVTFKVTVKPNSSPVMDAIIGMPLAKGVTTRIPLTNVHDGDADVLQDVTITASSSTVGIIPNPTVTFDQATGTGYLSITPAASAANGSTSTISVVLTDNGGTIHGGANTRTYTFDATVFAQVNKPPFFNTIDNQTAQNTSEVHSLTVTGVTNGEKGSSNITFSAVSSNPNVINNISFSPVSNGKYIMSYYTVGEGTATITVTLSDAQGNENNNGNLNYARTFTITSIPPSNTFFLENFNGTTVPFGVNGPREHTLTMDEGALKVKAKFPSQTYPGTIIDLTTIAGRTIDISKNPFIKIRLKSSSANKNGVGARDPSANNTQIELSLWDQDQDGGYQNATAKFEYKEDDQWHEFVLDYRGKFLKNDRGQVDSTKIKQLLITFDTRWWTDVEGEYWVDMIQMGDGLSAESISAVKGPQISNQTIFKGDVAKPVVLTGINDGLGGDKVSFDITNNNPGLVSNVAISNVINGSATLSYTLTAPNTKLDSAKIRVISFNPEQSGFKKDTVDFYVFAIDTTGTVPVTVTINRNEKFQTVEGMGTGIPTGELDLTVNAAKDLNLSVFRIFGSFDRIEEVNDNSDPNVLALENFKFNMTNMAEIRALHEATNAKFFYTILSAPFWLKHNKADHAFLGTQGYAGNNRYKADMYNEYAEYCVAIVRGLKAYAGIDLYGFSLQNEPEVGVPYVSSKVSPEEYVEMIKAVGRRFKAEGIATTIMMPEDVTGFPDWYLNQMKALAKDEEARSYVGMGAIHIYDDKGINPASGGSVVWTPFVNATKAAVPSGKLWMTEVSGFTNVWEGRWSNIYAAATFEPGPLVYAAILYRGFKFGQVNAWTDLMAYGQQFLIGSPVYSVYKSFTKYMVPGSVMVSATSSDNDILSLAFTHPDNTLTTILINIKKVPQKVKIDGAPGAYQMHTTMKHASFKDMGVIASGIVLLPANSISVLHSTSGNVKPTIDLVANKVVGISDGAETVNLTGITDGEVVKSQTLAVTAISADPSVATVSLVYNSPSSEASLVVTPVKVGTTKVKVLVKDNGGTAEGGIDSTFIEFTVNVTLVSSTAEAERSTINVFPNPANGHINVSMSAESITDLSIADLSGRVLLQQKMVSENKSTQVDVSDLTKGLYIITAKGRKSVLVTKFYKQ